nr:ATP-binding cassette domain-containing protein [Dehalococcoidales bacterium]
YVFQSFNLLGAFTALENVLIAMDLSDVVLPEARRPTARRLLEELGLGDRLHHRSGHLSHGEQQRVAVARALANNPGVILADEPTASVDPETRRIVLDRLLSEARDNGRILMVATHDHSILPGFDSVVSVSQGKAQEITREVHDAGVPANAS